MILVNQNQKPGNGFAIQKESNVPINDPYRTYENSVIDDDAIWQSLTTEAGRQALGASPRPCYHSACAGAVATCQHLHPVSDLAFHLVPIGGNLADTELVEIWMAEI